MPIAIGQKLPDATFTVKIGEKVENVAVGDYFSGARVALFAVPGAFTSLCSKSHLPGFIENYDAIRTKGIDKIAVVSVNDHHVMTAWQQATGGAERIDFLADGSGHFAKLLGLENDLTGIGMGIRSRRYSMLVEDGVVKQFNLEEARGTITNSGAAHLLGQL